jgi:hypothetical protein
MPGLEGCPQFCGLLTIHSLPSRNIFDPTLHNSKKSFEGKFQIFSIRYLPVLVTGQSKFNILNVPAVNTTFGSS